MRDADSFHENTTRKQITMNYFDDN